MTYPLTHLGPITTAKIIQALPSVVRDAFEHSDLRFYLGGGFIRAIVADEKPSDIDLFVPDQGTANALATFIAECSIEASIHRSANAITIRGLGRPIQIITRWTYTSASAIIDSFDYTLAQAVLWKEGGEWLTLVSAAFEEDVINRRLVYTRPIRDEEKAGSLVRLFKFYKRGYTPTLNTVADVCARAFADDSVSVAFSEVLHKAARKMPKAPCPGDTSDEPEELTPAGAQGFGASS